MMMLTESVSPKKFPLASASRQELCTRPVWPLGATRSTDSSRLAPTGIGSFRKTVVPRIMSPPACMKANPGGQAHEPVFCTSQVFVKASLAFICVPSGMVTSSIQRRLRHESAVVSMVAVTGDAVKLGSDVTVGVAVDSWASVPVNEKE